jgi:hypothetical protein
MRSGWENIDMHWTVLPLKQSRRDGFIRLNNCRNVYAKISFEVTENEEKYACLGPRPFKKKASAKQCWITHLPRQPECMWTAVEQCRQGWWDPIWYTYIWVKHKAFSMSVFLIIRDTCASMHWGDRDISSSTWRGWSCGNHGQNYWSGQ